MRKPNPHRCHSSPSSRARSSPAGKEIASHATPLISSAPHAFSDDHLPSNSLQTRLRHKGATFGINPNRPRRPINGHHATSVHHRTATVRTSSRALSSANSQNEEIS
ncbi:hypothetical protein V6N11_009656 [Hibiscus sabdariffa]|uniref:Uncharacterized protein n=1 Tax=Hibiscus sabdariffa TaxID=183260 RepID=A0ABR2P625_9ROSI